MTISIPWWAIPAGLLLAAFVVPAFLKSQGDYDMGTPLIQLAIFAALFMAGIGIFIGRLLS